ncbi:MULTISPECIES: DUF4920 domain-containing protein [Xanthocytophaga]|uniref:DUF4920 domain-containing protein n=1 Tax=Xanthocytophaga agilis TaxID=3048010 RepID=A0AAE3UCC9_9BACT|nr:MULTISPECIES: DUF4920 domain-containing protein [Xanthocytophaga]MDJ1469421.1 DUF4920 domain-containing protein [Xanthocytophaga flavus]MDJ1499216.1 DUF4920 domain-containing protein [Xanthocytophaga agilis]
MKKFVFAALTCLSGMVVQAQEKSATFGESFTPQNVIPVNQLAQAVEGKDSAFVQTEGIVKEVCQNKGCWMRVDAGNGQEMLVRFKNYAFFVPKDAAGKKVILKGKAFEQKTSVAELRHYAEDAGKSKKEIAKIKKPEKSVRFVADGVILE